MKLVKIVTLALMALTLIACKIEISNPKSDDEGVKTIVRQMSSETETIDFNEIYDFELIGSFNSLILKSSLRFVEINGSQNNVRIVDDNNIDKLTINGNRNTLVIEANDVFVTNIVIDGDNNYIVLSQCDSLTDKGEANQVVLLESGDCIIDD